jgi:hypothetical protein
MLPLSLWVSGDLGDGKGSNLAWRFGIKFTNVSEEQGGMGMKAFHNEMRDRSEIPCEGNCPYLVVTDTLNCRKDSEGVVDMEEVRDTGECPFWPHQKRGIG